MGGEPPDVMLINYRRFGTFADQGGLEPLSNYLLSSKVVSDKEFFPLALDSFRWQGELWCIPQNISSLVVFYNRDLFDEAGISYPENEWGWSEFLDTARELTKDVDGDGRPDIYGVGVTPNAFRLAPFIWQNGGRLVDNREYPTRLTMDDPSSLDAFQRFVDLQEKEKVAPDDVAELAENSQSRFLNGTLGMILHSRRGVPTFRTIESFQWDVAPLPRGRRPAGILHSDGYCMAAAAEIKDFAWTFIEFANSTTGQKIVASSGRTVPSLVAVAESEVFLDPILPTENSRVFIDTIPLSETVPIMSTWIAIEETLSREIERAYYGDVSVYEAALTAIDRTRAYFKSDSLSRQPRLFVARSKSRFMKNWTCFPQRQYLFVCFLLDILFRLSRVSKGQTQ
ncbi:MAG: sugar ABC transporter substrate-binding protein [Candidatus Promineifilaceae bacterium]